MGDGPQGRAEVAALLARHDLRPRRALGQHFLVDPNVVRKVVGLAGVGPGDRVVEVGAGTGTLTRALAATGARVVAYEIDDRLAGVLDEVLGGLRNVEVRIADVMKADLGAELEGRPWAMIANLPYHVGTPLVLDTLRRVPDVTRFVVMVQREVADRFAAGPGSKQYGLPSVVAALFAVPLPGGFRVGRSVFLPPPQVESAVVAMQRRPDVAPAALRAVELASAAFGQRRKTVRNSLAGALANPEAALVEAGLDPAARADHLAPGDYLRLAEVAGG